MTDRIAETFSCIWVHDVMTVDLFADAKIVEVPKGARVFEPGDPCKMFVILKEGEIRVDLLSESGKPVTLYHFGAGETCIMSASCLLSGDRLCGEAIVVEPVIAYAYSPAEFEQKLNASSDFRAFVFKAFAERLSRMMTKIDAVLTEPIETRLACVLLPLFGEKDEAHVTQEALAREVGTAREVISRKLGQWRKAGVLSSERGRLTLLNRRALQTLALHRD